MIQKKEQIETPIHSNPVPLVQVSGTHREMGQADWRGAPRERAAQYRECPQVAGRSHTTSLN